MKTGFYRNTIEVRLDTNEDTLVAKLLALDAKTSEMHELINKIFETTQVEVSSK